MKHSLIAVCAALLLLCACDKQQAVAPDRRASPEAALLAAQAALRRHDIAAYLDALTDGAVRQLLRSSIGICVLTKHASSGCEKILREHGWSAENEQSPAAFRAAIDKISNPRILAAALDMRYSAYGMTTNFVWDYLEGVTITDLVVDGARARATVQWNGEPGVMLFERDATGWRVDPLPEAEMMLEENAEEDPDEH